MYLNALPDVLTQLFFTKQSVELVGGPGIGKSAVIQQVREKLEARLKEPVGLATTILSQRDSVDIAGFMVPQREKIAGPDGVVREHTVSHFSTPPVFPMPHQYPDGRVPRYGIVFLDERAQASHDVQKTCAQLLLDGKIGDFNLADFGHWVVWCASNRMEDRSGTVRDLAFLTNRLLKINVRAHMDSWIEWAMKAKVNPLFIAYARQHPANIFRDTVPTEDGPFGTPRTLVMASRVADEECLGLDHPQLTECLSGLLGEGTAAELMTFTKVKDAAPTIEEILARPTKAKVPEVDRPDALYYVQQLLVHHANPDNCVKLIKYLTRLPKEFQVSTIQGCMRVSPELIETEEFNDWLLQHRELINATLSTT